IILPSLFFLYDPPPTEPYPLSLHDALPICGTGALMIIAIDGPAGSGKTTTARAVAQQLGFRHLETGAFYRAITLAALRAGIPPEKWGELTGADLDELGFEVRPDDFGFRFYLGDEGVTDALRSDLVTQRVSRSEERRVGNERRGR